MNTELTEIYEAVTDALAGPFEMMAIAEEEIAAAQERHPANADNVWHAFKLLNAGNLRDERLHYEMVYRAHCRELLDRVARGEDTRPGTAAEVCCVLREVSLVGPMVSHANGLYFRMWQAAGIAELAEITEIAEAHEAIEGGRIDDAEDDVRRRLTDPERVLDDIDCHGYHHGEPVTCRYTTEDDSEPVSEAASGNTSDNADADAWTQPELFAT